jgi:thiol:disulfide interchange protein
MKIFITLLMTLSLGFAAEIDEFASEVKYLRDYQTAIQTAKEQNKMVMLVVVGDYCPWCKKFERKTLKYSKVMAEADENFVGLVIDKYKDKGNYPKAFFSPLIPAVFFIDPATEKSLLDTVAYMKKDEFLENMEDALGLFEQKDQ